MRVSQAEKNKTRQRIVASAARMLRERGVDGASVADVMHDAGHTHGGFYRHFDSKDAMIAAALDLAFDEILPPAQGQDAQPRPEININRFVQSYLSDGHVAQPGRGCPIPALAADVGRASPDVQARFTSGVRRLADVLTPDADPISNRDPVQRAAALRQLAMMAGAVMLARACDPDTAAEILTACRAPPDQSLSRP